MINASNIHALVDEKIEGTGMFVVELTVSSSNRIVIELDNLEGVTIDDCVQVSRHVESSLDRETQDFELQVSSAGIDKPLRDRRQYVKNVGRELRMQLNDGAELKGELIEAGEKVKLKLPASKKKKLPEREELVEWENIKEAKIIISFK
ncbi:MAG: ribosome assembly cofactor RimP [Flavobacteriales bacterium]|nr:ribosome assembly cofactor RimP [Flavobacteriales bacterium]